jgi:hypothetical protein
MSFGEYSLLNCLICWFRKHDLFELETAWVCRRCHQFWRKRDQVEVLR